MNSLKIRLKAIIILIYLLISKISFSQVLINEIMLKPSSDAISSEFQSLKVCSQPSYGSEYIEIYNANSCFPADISCYFIGFRIWNNQSDGAFRFPAGTVIPPLGFLSIGGPNSGATINLFDFCSDTHLQTGADRWYLENGDAYVAFYDESGNPIDAVYWTTFENEANKWGTDSDLDEGPSFVPIGGTCPNVSSLAGPLSPELTAVVDYAGKTPDMGLVIHRTSDGASTWETNATPSINSCNGECQTGSPFMINASITEPSCNSNDGLISLNPFPNATYTYLWQHDGSELNQVSNLNSGSYTVSVNNGSCSKDTTITLSASSNVILNPIISHTSCGENNGEITIAPSPADSYLISWDIPDTGNQNQVTNLPSGQYSVSVSSSGGCTKDSIIIINPSTIFQIQFEIDEVTCLQNDGSISVNVHPAGNYNFVWSHDATLNASLASNLSSGDYQINISDGTCNKDTTLTLAQPTGCCTITLNASLTSTPNTACEGTSNPCNYSGPSILINEINIFPTTGDGSIFGLGPNGQIAAGEWIELYNPDWCNEIDISGFILGSFNSTSSAVPPLQSNGMAFVLPQGSIVPPQGFAIVRGINAPIPPQGVIDIVVDNVDNRLCIEGGIVDSRVWFQNSGGWFAFYNADGIPQDAIQWNVPNSDDLDGNPCVPITNSLPLGTTSLASFNESGVVNILGAPSQGQTFVRIPDGGLWSTISANENFSYGSCNVPGECNTSGDASSTCNGSINVNLINGQAPFVFTWNDNLNQFTQNADSLCVGDYSVTIIDANGCVGTFSQTVAEDFFEIAAISINPSCSNDDGEISVLTSQSGNYTYTWSPNANVQNNNTTEVNNLSSGTYSVEVSANSCTRDTTITLIAPPPITNVQITQNDENCNQSNGQIVLSNVEGGTLPFQYNFNNQGFTSQGQYNNLQAGVYDIIITDQNGCIYQVLPITIQNLAGPTDFLYQTENSICDQANGLLNLTQILGGESPYLINVNNQGSNTALLYENLLPGEYNVEITDANNCVYEETVVIINDNSSSPTSIEYTLDLPVCGINNGKIENINVIGGTEPFVIQVNNEITNSFSISDLSLGNYVISIIDANGCKIDSLVIISDFIGEETLLIPNVFTPSEDATNDSWFVLGSCIKNYNCKIFNRWGNLIYEMKEITEKWDGKTNENKVTDGVYFYVIDVEYFSGKKNQHHGNISLIKN